MQVSPDTDTGLAAARYSALQATVNPSVRRCAPHLLSTLTEPKSLSNTGLCRYNTPWSSFETSKVVPAPAPVSCPAGYTMVLSHRCSHAHWLADELGSAHSLSPV